ncbi:nuclear nucleic acid-binding protein C1D-like [Haliotis cracherodii]|uniref:nuclear nucleic acid-binding protein C1D-like n=1 Tax=Haliotis cracherodii TaxID=6455 RepID=UPI0039E93008
MTSGEDGGGIPSEMKEKLASFDSALTSLETELKPLLAKPRMEFFEKLEPLDMGKMDLVASYAVNSLFWMYLNVCGVNPKDHAIKQELERVRGYMNRVKEIQDKAKAPKVNAGAAKRMVKSALWQAAQKKVEQQGRDEEGPSQSRHSLNAPGGCRKRKLDDIETRKGRRTR